MVKYEVGILSGNQRVLKQLAIFRTTDSELYSIFVKISSVNYLCFKSHSFKFGVRTPKIAHSRHKPQPS